MNFFTDILLNEDNDIDFENGDFKYGESTLQDVGIILQLNSGELKSDPVLGPNLVQLSQGKKEQNSIEFERRVRIHLERDGKNYEQIKELITLRQR